MCFWREELQKKKRVKREAQFYGRSVRVSGRFHFRLWFNLCVQSSVRLWDIKTESARMENKQHVSVTPKQPFIIYSHVEKDKDRIKILYTLSNKCIITICVILWMIKIRPHYIPSWGYSIQVRLNKYTLLTSLWFDRSNVCSENDLYHVLRRKTKWNSAIINNYGFPPLVSLHGCLLAVSRITQRTDLTEFLGGV